MQRIAVIGTSCSGKSTLAAQLANRLELTHVELDTLHWDPNWVEVSDDRLRLRVTETIDEFDSVGRGWVIDGNYAKVRDLVWPKTDTIIWLNYSLPMLITRSIRRTLRRVLRGDRCCNGNRESLRRTLSRESIPLWVLQTCRRRRREFSAILPEYQDTGRQILIFRHPSETSKWLASVQRSSD